MRPKVVDLAEIRQKIETQALRAREASETSLRHIEGLAYRVMKLIARSLPSGVYLLPGDVILRHWKRKVGITFLGYGQAVRSLQMHRHPDEWALRAFHRLLQKGWCQDIIPELEKMGAPPSCLQELKRIGDHLTEK